jgi:4-azaleucine resistance transporter AzlC
MSTFIYAGSMQFAAISLMTSAFSPVSAFLLTLMVNARHLFYGLSMLKPFERMGKRKPYMIFSLTDETYSLLCGVSAPQGIDPDWFLFFISLLDQLYWIIGSCIGAAAGSFLAFDSTGIDFAMTALFLVIFVEQWEKANSRIPALLGLGITLVSLIVVGSDRFLLFSMAGILAALLLFRKEISK